MWEACFFVAFFEVPELDDWRYSQKLADGEKQSGSLEVAQEGDVDLGLVRFPGLLEREVLREFSDCGIRCSEKYRAMTWCDCR